MTLLVATPKRLGSRLRVLRPKLGDALVIAFRAEPVWKAEPTLAVGDRRFAVRACPSGLAVREALVEQARAGHPLVILTDREETDLGLDVLARLAKRRLLRLDGWESVMEAFGAGGIDPRLVGEAWMPSVLLELEPTDGYPRVPAGYLDADTAWRHVTGGRLGLDLDAPPMEGVLRFTMDEGNLVRWAAETPELRDSCRRRLEGRSGAAAEAVLAALRCVEAGHGRQAIPVGLVLDVLYAPERAETPEMRDAAVRLESFLGGTGLPEAAARRWADAAAGIVKDLVAVRGRGAARGWLDAAEALLARVRATGFAHGSALLPLGLAQRLDRLGAALAAGLAADPVTVPEEVDAAARAALSHALLPRIEGGVLAVEMAVRLARWVAQRSAGNRAATATLEAAVKTWQDEGSFVDWARSAAADQGLSVVFRDALSSLLARAEALREEENRDFGRLLARWAESAPARGLLLPVERILDEVVVPVARATPVLLLVMDGMGGAVFRALLADLVRQGWDLHEATDEAARGPAMAVLPPVTEASRTSLLLGRLASGAAAREKDGFPSHAGLRAVSRAKKPPVLFHKEDLSEGRGPMLAGRVGREVGDPGRQVVGVVLNAVDDWLARGEQLVATWETAQIRYLDPILNAAREAGRTVVLTSDHGHVIERGTVGRQHDTGGERWRLPEGTVGPEEVRLRGPRVLFGGDIVVPWTEKLRYGVKKNGYHGGATPQEVVVPLAVLTAYGAPVTGFVETAPVAPAWWEPPVRGPVVRPVVPEVRPPVVPPKKQRTLFEPPPVPESWIEGLVASETFKAQFERHRRVAPEIARVRQFLSALDERGGQMMRDALAARLGISPTRLSGVLTALRRILNVEGYGVLEVDDASGMVVLSRELLKSQFELR